MPQPRYGSPPTTDPFEGRTLTNKSQNQDLDAHIPESRVIQIGLPRIPLPNSPIHFDILRHWLHDCDTHHPSCRPIPLNTAFRPPTRLVEVGTKAAPLARLIETTPGFAPRYLALSHPWGAPPHFCTTPTSLRGHLDQLPVDSLRFPATFRGATAITCELGLPYLWIDSLCIVQGRGGDFDAEAHGGRVHGRLLRARGERGQGANGRVLVRGETRAGHGKAKGGLRWIRRAVGCAFRG